MPEFTRYWIYMRNLVSHSIGINYPWSGTYTPLPLSDPHLFKQVDSKLDINNLARKCHILNSGCNVIWRKWQDRLEAIRAGKMGKEISVPPSRCHRASPGFQDSGARATYRCKTLHWCCWLSDGLLRYYIVWDKKFVPSRCFAVAYCHHLQNGLCLSRVLYLCETWCLGVNGGIGNSVLMKMCGA